MEAVVITGSFPFRFLLCGDINSAEARFNFYQPKTAAQAVFKQIDKGLVSVAQNDYEEAFKHFQEAHEKDKDNVLVRKFMSTNPSILQ